MEYMKEINAINKAVLLISDLHLPYAHPDFLKFLKKIKLSLSPQIIISMGDLVDGHAISFHDNDVELLSAGNELEKAIAQVKLLHKLFPKMCVLESNHGSLVTRRLKHHGIPIAHLKSDQDLYSTPKWLNYPEILLHTKHPRSTYLHHGKSAAYNKLALEEGINAAQGHFHTKFEIQHIRAATGSRYNMFCGCLIDLKSMAFAYGRNNLRTPALGVSFIDKNGDPYLIPMNLNSKGRWDGKISKK